MSRAVGGLRLPHAAARFLVVLFEHGVWGDLESEKAGLVGVSERRGVTAAAPVVVDDDDDDDDEDNSSW